MSHDKENYLQELEELGIVVKNIVHVLLVGQVELIAELVEDKESGDYIFLNPIKILKDAYIDPEGNYNCNNLFVAWSSCIEDPFIFIKSQSVISISKPNSIALEYYLDVIKEEYYGEFFDEDIDESDSDDEEEFYENNVIDFNKYFKRL